MADKPQLMTDEPQIPEHTFFKNGKTFRYTPLGEAARKTLKKLGKDKMDKSIDSVYSGYISSEDEKPKHTREIIKIMDNLPNSILHDNDNKDKEKEEEEKEEEEEEEEKGFTMIKDGSTVLYVKGNMDPGEISSSESDSDSDSKNYNKHITNHNKPPPIQPWNSENQAHKIPPIKPPRIKQPPNIKRGGKTLKRILKKNKLRKLIKSRKSIKPRKLIKK
jgi:hypothetical protein